MDLIHYKTFHSEHRKKLTIAMLEKLLTKFEIRIA